MKTIIYITSNRENPEFEGKIQQTLIENCGGLPIISVSQKPISLGNNICVGDVGHSYLNTFRQLLIGAYAAKSEYVVCAEADFLYPKEYFLFIPGGGNLYRHRNVWLVFRRKFKNIHQYYRKQYSNGAQIVKRSFLIDVLEDYLDGQPMWADGEFVVRDKKGVPKEDYNGATFEFFGGEEACVSFKTGDGMTERATISRERSTNIPPWGDIILLREKYL